MINLLPYRLGVGLVIINDQLEIFTGRRLDNTKAWQMPQGGIDNNEIPLEAAYREMYEETCLLYTSPSPRDKRQSRMPSSA